MNVDRRCRLGRPSRIKKRDEGGGGADQDGGGIKLSNRTG